MPRTFGALGRFAGAGFVAFWAMLVAGTAMAMDSCSGEFSSAALQPLPQPAVIALDLSDSTPTNSTLGAAFTRGMADAGAQVPGSQPATVQLRLTYSIIGQGGSNPGQDDGSSRLWSGNSETFMQGGINPQNPDIPTYDSFHPAQPTQSGMLILRAEARNAANGAIDWIGSVQCTLQGSDDQALAYQLGRLIGGSIGQRRSRIVI